MRRRDGYDLLREEGDPARGQDSVIYHPYPGQESTEECHMGFAAQRSALRCQEPSWLRPAPTPVLTYQY